MGLKIALKVELLASLVHIRRRGEGLIQFFICHGSDSKHTSSLFLSASLGSIAAVFWFVHRTSTLEFGSFSSNTAAAPMHGLFAEHLSVWLYLVFLKVGLFTTLTAN